MFELEEQIQNAFAAHEARETARADALAAKVDALAERHYAAVLAEQQARADVRVELNSLAHVTRTTADRVDRVAHVVLGNGREGLDARVLKIEHTLARMTAQQTRTALAVWSVLGGVALYLAQAVLTKLF